MTIPGGANLETKIGANKVLSLAGGDAAVVDARGMANLTIITDGAATATCSRVDDAAAGSHVAGAPSQFTVSPITRTVTPVDWPFYRVSSASGVTRVAIV